MKRVISAFCILLLSVSIVLNASAIDNEGESNGCTWKFEKGVLSFDGTGLIPLLLHPHESWSAQEKFNKSVKQIVIGKDISGLEEWNALDHYPSVTKVVYGVDYLEGMFVLADKIKEVVYQSDKPYVLAHNFCFSRLNKITFESENADYIQEGNILYNRDRTEVFYYFGSKSENVKIPEGVKIIRSGAFACSKIKSVEFPSTLEKIERCAFIRCSNLKSVTIPESCKVIGSSAFSACDKLQSIEFQGDTIELIALYGREEDPELAELGGNFGWNKSLKEITLPACEIVPYQCFHGCKNLKKVVFSEGTKEIRGDMFEGCDKLEVVVIPDGASFASDTFVNNKKLVIHCHAGSEAEKLAKKYKLKYEIIE